MSKIATMAALAGLAMIGFAGTAAAQNETPGTHAGPAFAVPLTGREEAPGPGDPDGLGRAKVTLHSNQVCFELEAHLIGAATAAHIHRGAVGVAGPILITLSPPTSGKSQGCVHADPHLIEEIRTHPAAFYVNVHNAEYPAGAIRGQLPGGGEK